MRLGFASATDSVRWVLLGQVLPNRDVPFLVFGVVCLQMGLIIGKSLRRIGVSLLALSYFIRIFVVYYKNSCTMIFYLIFRVDLSTFQPTGEVVGWLANEDDARRYCNSHVDCMFAERRCI